MASRVETADRTVVWNGRIGIECAATVRQELLDALSGSSGVVLDLGAVSGIDLAGIQLIIAGEAYARKAGKRFSLSGKVDGEVLQSFRDCGFVQCPPGDGELIEKFLFGEEAAS